MLDTSQIGGDTCNAGVCSPTMLPAVLLRQGCAAGEGIHLATHHRGPCFWCAYGSLFQLCSPVVPRPQLDFFLSLYLLPVYYTSRVPDDWNRIGVYCMDFVLFFQLFAVFGCGWLPCDLFTVCISLKDPGAPVAVLDIRDVPIWEPFVLARCTLESESFYLYSISNIHTLSICSKKISAKIFHVNCTFDIECINLILQHKLTEQVLKNKTQRTTRSEKGN